MDKTELDKLIFNPQNLMIFYSLDINILFKNKKR